MLSRIQSRISGQVVSFTDLILGNNGKVVYGLFPVNLNFAANTHLHIDHLDSHCNHQNSYMYPQYIRRWGEYHIPKNPNYSQHLEQLQ